MTTPLVPPRPPDTGGPATPGGFWGDGSRRGPAGTLAEGLGVVTTGLRLLARHWPVLLILYLAGVVAHGLAMRAAVRVSLVNAELGMLVLLLAPMATLTSLVLMLRAVRPSLPWLAGTGRPIPVLAHLGSVLVPFLTIYYFEDYLYDDLSDYAYQTWLDDTQRGFARLGQDLASGGSSDPVSTVDRLPFDLSVWMVAVVLAAIAGRWLLSRYGRGRRRAWLGIPGAYLELVWLTLVVLAFVAASELILEWGGNRQLVHAIQEVWNQAVGTATGVAPSTDGATSWFIDKLGYVDAVLIIPVSWLAVGAVVLGHEPPEALRAAAAKVRRGGALVDALGRRWAAAPAPVRWVGEKLTDDLRERFTPLLRGTRLLVRAGVVPMLLFCLAFVIARTVADWLWELQRLLIGPGELVGLWMPLSGPLSQLNTAAGHVVMVCLLAAAVDRALHASQDELELAEPAGPPPGTGPAERRAGAREDARTGAEPWRYPDREPTAADYADLGLVPAGHPGDRPEPVEDTDRRPPAGDPDGEPSPTAGPVPGPRTVPAAREPGGFPPAEAWRDLIDPAPSPVDRPTTAPGVPDRPLPGNPDRPTPAPGVEDRPQPAPGPAGPSRNRT